MPGGGQRQPELGWGPEFAGREGLHIKHVEAPRKRRNGLVAGLLVLGGVALLMVIVALALR
jgi:hypothetical protein